MAADQFLKIKGIDGECTQKGHEKELEIESFSFGASHHGTSRVGGGASGGKTDFQDFHFTIHTGKASAPLFKYCCTGEHIDECVLTARKATGKGGQEDYLRYSFKHVLISNHSISGHGDGTPMEQVSFNFTEVKMEYKDQLPDGKLGAWVETKFNVKTGTA